MQNKKGSIVAIEPSTGEVLAIISSPAYNPNLLVGKHRSKNYRKMLIDENKPLFNRAIMSKQNPPGSTFKPAQALIGLQEGILVPETRYPCSGGFSLGGGKRVSCHGAHTFNVRQSIQHSCNTYYCKAFRDIVDYNKKFKTTREGYRNWYNHIRSFGFGKKTGVDLPNETEGSIKTVEYYDKSWRKKNWRAVSIISVAIGQGEVGATTLQLANYSAAIANRGYYINPHLIKAVGTKDNIKKDHYETKYTSVHPKHYNIVVDGMYDVVNVPGGTATGAKIDSIQLCGKTGTAQNPHGENHSVFIAFAPKDNPVIAIAVFVENAGYGSTYAAPIASLMVEKYIKRKVKRIGLENRMMNAKLIKN